MHLSKHHGLGNDFLVLLDDEADADPSLARALCDRHRGVGADGLIIGRRPDGAEGADAADLEMLLLNADGSTAEMSGNGIRCLAQAEARRRGVAATSMRILTGGGVRTVEVAAGPDPVTSLVAVDMGRATPGPDLPREGVAPLWVSPLKVATVGIGNPHVVLLVEDAEAVDPGVAGPAVEAHFPDGINVHFVAPTAGEPDALTMRVWERGAGVTEACGTGACAVAVAAHDWGLVGRRVTVRMPGGPVDVALGRTVTLVGPAVHIADLEVPEPAWR
jgi:diaminopimelate epimerase